MILLPIVGEGGRRPDEGGIFSPLPWMGGVGGGCKLKPLNLTQTAKELRVRSTDAEHLLWYYLKSRQLNGLKFRRQEQIGRFIVDFVCYECRLIIEADGGQHAVEQEKDAERTAWLDRKGSEW